MKKAVFMGVVFVVLAFGSMSYMNYLNSGQMVLPFANLFKGQDAASAVNVLKNKVSDVKQEVSSKTDATTEVFKWQDAQGQWHYGNKVPDDVHHAKTVSINQNQNIIDSVKVPEPKSADTQSSANKPIVKPNPYSPAQVKKTIDDAKNVQKLLDDRLEKQNKALDNLR